MTRSWRLCDVDAHHPDDAAAWSSATTLGLGVEVCVVDATADLAEVRGLGGPGRPVAALLLRLDVALWADPDGAGRVAFSCARACAELGLTVLGVTAAADHAGADVAPALALVATMVAPVRIALGPVVGTAVGTHAQAAEIAGRVGGAGVLLDTAAAWAANEDPAELVDRLGPQLAMVHLGDALSGGARLPFGAVHAPQRLLEALDAGGYAGTAALDVAGVPGDPTSALRSALAATA